MYVDKRLAGIQAVQTLSRLNRAYPGKDTTYVVDFANDGEEILAAFKTYHTTAELENITDSNLVFDLRMKLDAAGYYDNFEVDRVVAVEFKENAKQGDLFAALETGLEFVGNQQDLIVLGFERFAHIAAAQVRITGCAIVTLIKRQEFCRRASQPGGHAYFQITDREMHQRAVGERQQRLGRLSFGLGVTVEAILIDCIFY